MRVHPAAETRAHRTGAADSEPVRLDEASAPTGSELGDAAVDALAQLLRLLGKHAFDTDRTPRQGFSQRCEAWARHVLMGRPVEGDAGAAATPPRGETSRRRAWSELRAFIERHRLDEVSFVRGQLGGFRTVVSTLARGLRSAMENDEAIDSRILRHLERLELAAQSGSVASLQRLVPDTVVAIRHELDTRRLTVRERLAALGAQLSQMRQDLADSRKDAQTDALTQLFNRGAFDRVLQQQVRLSTAAGEPLVLAMVDIDHFKRVNDTYGHATGDEVLKSVADTIVRAFPRKNDFVARYGGEEFALLLRDVDGLTAKLLLERLLANVRAMEVVEDRKAIRVTCSAGFAELQADDSGEQLFERADEALYQAKRGGRDKVVPG